MNYKKEDAIIRHTLKTRKSTMAAKVGDLRKGSVNTNAEYNRVSMMDTANNVK